jgi:hypothetical protein
LFHVLLLVYNHLLLVILDGVVFVVGEVPIGVGYYEGGSHEGDSLREFATNGEHMSIGTSEGDSLREFATNGEHMSIGTRHHQNEPALGYHLVHPYFGNALDLGPPVL